jgi:V8-like Glu-specific endopeptidase
MANFQTKVIYGNDDRQEVYESSRKLKYLAKSVFAMVDNSKIKYGIFFNELMFEAYGNAHKLCIGEKFFNQPSISFCTSFLVGKNLVATAGHCINEYTCPNISFVLDYNMINNSTPRLKFWWTQTYKCVRVIKREKTDDKQDYALVEIERYHYVDPDREKFMEPDREPLKLSQKAPKVGDNLVMLGFPSGLPLKIDSGSKIREVLDTHFVANTDSYAGNSGSPVLNAETLEVEGILVRGEIDFVHNTEKNCYNSKICNNNECEGEDSTLIKYVKGK